MPTRPPRLPLRSWQRESELIFSWCDIRLLCRLVVSMLDGDCDDVYESKLAFLRSRSQEHTNITPASSSRLSRFSNDPLVTFHRFHKPVTDTRRIISSRRLGARGTNRSTTPLSQTSESSSFQPAGGNNFSFTFGNTQSEPQSNGPSPSPAPFQFASAPPSATPAQNPFANNSATTTSFGSTFGGGVDSQSNAFNPSTTSMFGQSQAQSTPSFSFGQNLQTQATNGTSAGNSNPFSGFGGQQQAAPSNSLSFGQNQSKNSNPFAGFGQSTQQSGTPSFGQTPQSSTLFGGFGQKPAETGIVASSQASNGLGLTGFNQTSQVSASKTSATDAAPSIFGGFGQKPQENGTKSLFGSSVLDQPTPKPAENIFGGLSQATQKSDETTKSTGLFGSSVSVGDSMKPATPGASIFSALPAKAAPKSDKPLFDSSMAYRGEDDDEPSVDANGAKKNDTASSNANTSESSKTNPFAGFGSSQNSTQSSAFQSKSPNVFAFNQSQSAEKTQNTNITQETPKASNIFGSMGATNGFLSAPISQSSNLPTPSQTNIFSAGKDSQVSQSSSKPRSLFDRIESPAVPPSFSDETPKAQNIFGAATGSSSSGFTPSTKLSFDSPAKSVAATPFTPSTTSLFAPPTASAAQSETPKASPPKNIFERSTVTSSALTPAPAPAATTHATPSTAAINESLVDSKTASAKLRLLNEGFIAHLQDAKLDQDWSAAMRYYLKTTDEICGRPSRTDSAKSPAAASSFSTEKITPSSGIFASQSTPTSTSIFPGTSKTSSFTSSNFAQTPKPATSTNVFANPPQTAPTKKRPAEDGEDTLQAPATEKRSRVTEPVNYPKLPDTASKTAKLFQATLDKESTSERTTTSGAGNPVAQPAGFTPSFASSATSTSAAGSVPSFGAPAASGGFLSSFGKAAQQQAAKDAKKRRDEEYDSEDETPEQYEKRTSEERETKRLEILEAQKTSSGFSFSKTSSAAPSTVSTSGTPASGLSATPAGKPPANIFASLNSTTSQTPTSEQTPKVSTSLKPANGFSAAALSTPAATPSSGALGGLFGAAPTPSLFSQSTSTAKSVSFDFGSKSTPNTATPTDDSRNDDEPSDTPPEPPSHDQSELLPEERKGHEVLFELPPEKKAQVLRFEYAPDPKESGKFRKGFVSKGIGKLYVLNNKTTGKTRVLAKILGLGRVVMNFDVIGGASYNTGANKKVVIGQFIDHIHTSEKNERGVESTVEPGLRQWMIRVADDNVAARLVEALKQAQAPK
ncbi:hypothetical protein MRB53_042393 [Persea americana]|nr:hypothetical protein MRB53_042393 [Persea americana]